MIQRIQHLYMLIMATICLWFLYTPIIAGHILMQEQRTYKLTAIGFFQQIESGGIITVEDFTYIAILLGLLSCLSFLNIFLFRNRNLQNAFCLLNYVLIVILIASITNEWFKQLSDEISIDSITMGSIGKLMMLASLLIFNHLAMRALRKDEELIRSADRIR